MSTLPIDQLRVGQVLDRAIQTPRGLTVLAPGEPITPETLERLAQVRGGFVRLGPAVPPPDPAPAATPNADSPGTTGGDSGDLTREPDPEAMERARRRAARRAWEAERQTARVRSGLRRQADELVQSLAPRWERLPRRIAPGPESVPLASLADTWSGPLALELASERAERVVILRRTWERLLSAERVRAATLLELADELVDLFSRHPDRFAALALGTRRIEESVCEHAYATGALCVAIAARLQWSLWDVRAAALAGFMADSGMMLLPSDLRSLPRALTEVEWNALHRHPAYSLVLCSHVLDMPEAVGLAVYQHHEREDGSGYPGGTRGAIHDLARVVAVADVLAGASAERPHRRRSTAHGAVQLVVHEAAAGRLDKATVRAAVRAVGVFPAGSFVRLSSGHLGLVESVRDPERADRPVVRLVGADRRAFEGEEPMTLSGNVITRADAPRALLELKSEVVDLADPAAAEVSIVEALDVPEEVSGLMVV